MVHACNPILEPRRLRQQGLWSPSEILAPKEKKKKKKKFWRPLKLFWGTPSHKAAGSLWVVKALTWPGPNLQWMAGLGVLSGCWLNGLGATSGSKRLKGNDWHAMSLKTGHELIFVPDNQLHRLGCPERPLLQSNGSPVWSPDPQSDPHLGTREPEAEGGPWMWVPLLVGTVAKAKVEVFWQGWRERVKCGDKYSDEAPQRAGTLCEDCLPGVHYFFTHQI